MKTALTIAGSDASGGAGIQADIKTMTMLGVYAMSAITALTAQNTTGVQGIFEVDRDFLAQQLKSIFSDIPPDAVKIGMLSSKELIEVIRESLMKYEAKNIVLDPVMIATSGALLLEQDAIGELKRLFPLASIITPNLFEARELTSRHIETREEMEEAAESLSKEFGCAVLIKGGHIPGDASDVLYIQGEILWLDGERIDNPNTHGTGCTLSSAIAAELAKGVPLELAVKNAKDYVSGAIRAELNLGSGRGPLMHNWKLLKEKQ